ncbi:MAG TPA: TonB-dependent receptor, partial [Calditrichia bacterium]|nr:TonB-dependent receptor [Calditrichia bacterium]
LRYEYLNTYADYNPDIATTYDEGGRASDGNRLQSAEAKHRISPRVSLSFPITSEGIIRFSYGIFYQNPTFRNIYRNPRFLDLDRFAAGTPSFGNANLNPQKSIQYELGLQQQFTEDLKIDLTVFYKDVNDLIQTRRVSLGESVTRQFDLITNISYANVKGFTVALLKRRSNTGLFSGTIDYTYQIGEGAYDDPVALTINTNSGRQNPQKLVPLDFDRTHTINATVTLSKANNFSASMIGTLRGGTPYTPVVPNEFQTVSFEINSERRPVQYNVNLKAEKFFKTGFGKFSVFAFVENLFDFQTERFVHENTGRSLSNLEEVTNPGLFDNLRRDLANDPQDYFPVRFLDDYYQREDWLGAPREVRFGLSYSF